MRISDVEDDNPVVKLELTRREACVLGALLGQQSWNSRKDALNKSGANDGCNHWRIGGHEQRDGEFFDKLYSALSDRFAK